MDNKKEVNGFRNLILKIIKIMKVKVKEIKVKEIKEQEVEINSIRIINSIRVAQKYSKKNQVKTKVKTIIQK